MKDEIGRLTAELARVTKELDEAQTFRRHAYADAMIAHLWFAEQFGEVMNGRDFAVKVQMATKQLADLKRENAELRADRDRRSLLMMEAALSLISYERSYGGGSGEDEAIELAIFCGYPDDEPRTAEEVQIWLTGAIGAARKAKVDVTPATTIAAAENAEREQAGAVEMPCSCSALAPGLPCALHRREILDQMTKEAVSDGTYDIVPDEMVAVAPHGEPHGAPQAAPQAEPQAEPQDEPQAETHGETQHLVERDPRIDPRPGDVVHFDRALQPFFVTEASETENNIYGHFGASGFRGSLCGFSYWRKCAANAKVVKRAEDAQGGDR